MITRNRQFRAQRRPALDLTGRSRSEQAYFETGIRGRGPWMPFAHANTAHQGLAEADYWQTFRQRSPIIFPIAGRTLGAVWQTQTGTLDYQIQAFYGALSSDGGRTWDSPQLLYDYPEYSSGVKWVALGAAGVHDGRLHLLYSTLEDENGGTGGIVATITNPFYAYTDDLTFASGLETPVDLNASINPDEWPWFIFGPGRIIRLQGGAQAGTLVAPFDRRAVIGSTSYAGVIYSADGGSTWALGAQFDPAESDNDNTNETDLCEIGSTGLLYINSRINSGTGRRHAVISDVTDADNPFTGYDMTFDGTNPVNSYNCCGSVCSTANGDVFWTGPMTAVSPLRGRISCLLSSDAKAGNPNPTFPTWRPIQLGWGGYSSIISPGGEDLVVVCEHARNQPQDNSIGLEYLELKRFNKTWLQKPATHPIVIEYPFNEATTGLVSRQGCPIRDHGTHGVHIPGSGNTAEWGDGYVHFAGGSNAGLLIEPLQSGTGEPYGGPFQLGTQDVTCGLRFRTSDTTVAVRYLIDNRNGTGRGWSISKLATHNFSVSLSDATYSRTVILSDAAYNLNDGLWHTLWASQDYAGGLRVWVSNVGGAGENVFTEATAASSALSSYVTSTLACRLGSRSDGTLGLTCDVSALRFTIGQAINSPVDLSSITKTDPDTLLGNQAVLPSIPAETAAALANISLRLGCFFHDGGRALGADIWGGFDHGYIPPHHNQGVGCLRDSTAKKLWRSYSHRPNRVIVSDYCGPMLRLPRISGGTTTAYLAAWDEDDAATLDDFADYLHETGVFGVSMIVATYSLASSTMIFINKDTSSGVGTWIYLQSGGGGVWLLLISSAGTVLSHNAFPVGFAADGVPHYLGFDGGGDGQKVRCYYGAYGTGLTPPASLSTADSTGNITNLAAGASGRPPSFGAALTAPSTDAFGGDFAMKNMIFSPAAFGPTVHQQLADLGVY